jgi:hypothetical protein
MPAHHKLEAFIHEYLATAGIREIGKTSLFRLAVAKTGLLTDKPMNRIDACRMVRRRTAGLCSRSGSYATFFWTTGITAHLDRGWLAVCPTIQASMHGRKVVAAAQAGAEPRHNLDRYRWDDCGLGLELSRIGSDRLPPLQITRRRPWRTLWAWTCHWRKRPSAWSIKLARYSEKARQRLIPRRYQRLKVVGVAIEHLGLEAGPLSPWLSQSLQAAGLPAVCIETRRMKGATAAMAVKTDRNDAGAIAQAMRVGWFTAVHVKTAESQELRVLLTNRKMDFTSAGLR